ncbi:MAG: helix-turn-helix transcriptional regulator [Planctomycetes bacterium]|nr:helix-turn-helix transcriptional regulator [Planctomycetota bacterium]NUQ35631.1 helix-turn-helix transcriptional regulator [Planctomycetaceae bacterium]
MNAYDEGLKQRIAEIVEKKSQAEVARLTDTTRTNVSRYVRGRRVPASFCGALVDKLGVNPAWLMTGEGAPLLSDTAKSTEYLAGDMLELVKAMNSVSRMRLGALAGKEHLKVLRELNDNLERYRELKHTIGKRANPVMKQLLDDLEQALTDLDENVCNQRIAAVNEISELCDDEALKIRFDELKQRNAYLGGRGEEALAILRRLYARYLPEADRMNDALFQCATRLASAFEAEGRYPEARAIIRSTLAMADAYQCGLDTKLRLYHWGALINFELGELETATHTLERLCQRGEANDYTRALLSFYMWIGSSLPFEAAWQGAKDNNNIALDFLRAAITLEDPVLIERLLRHLEASKMKETIPVLHARNILGKLKGGAAPSAERHASLSLSPDEKVSFPLEFTLLTYRVQFLRLRGQQKKALETLEQAHTMFMEKRPRQAPYFWAKVLHYRNVFELFGMKPKEAARLQVVRESMMDLMGYLERGYRVLVPLAKPFDIPVITVNRRLGQSTIMVHS